MTQQSQYSAGYNLLWFNFVIHHTPTYANNWWIKKIKIITFQSSNVKQSKKHISAGALFHEFTLLLTRGRNVISINLI